MNKETLKFMPEKRMAKELSFKMLLIVASKKKVFKNASLRARRVLEDYYRIRVA